MKKTKRTDGSYDVLIAGAGFAGLALAIALRQGLGESFVVAVADPALGRAAITACAGHPPRRHQSCRT